MTPEQATDGHPLVSTPTLASHRLAARDSTAVDPTSEAASSEPTSHQVDAGSQAEPGAGRTAAPHVSTPERDRRNGRFIPGNRAAARRPEIGRDAARKAHRRNRDLAGMITEQVTQAQVKAHVARLGKIIERGDDREALAAFVEEIAVDVS